MVLHLLRVIRLGGSKLARVDFFRQTLTTRIWMENNHLMGPLCAGEYN